MIRLSFNVTLVMLLFFLGCGDDKKKEEKKDSSWNSRSIEKFMESCTFGGKSIDFCECTLDIYREEFSDFKNFEDSRDMFDDNFQKIEYTTSLECSKQNLRVSKSEAEWSSDQEDEFVDFFCNKLGWYDHEPFIDQGNGVYDGGENFTDLNGNGRRDRYEEFTDEGNGSYDFGEFFTDENGNGIWDGNYKESCECFFLKFSEISSYEDFLQIEKFNSLGAMEEYLNEVFDLCSSFSNTIWIRYDK